MVITGATSGIGKVAAETLIAAGHNVVVGARGTGVPTGAKSLALDLNSLKSVRSFADAVTGPIDALVLNAGMQRYDIDARSADGFEQTFAVNHLAPYLLARLLLSKIANSGRIVLTSSGTHDPAEKTGVPVPRHANAAWLANPATAPDTRDGPRVAGLRLFYVEAVQPDDRAVPCGDARCADAPYRCPCL